MTEAFWKGAREGRHAPAPSQCTLQMLALGLLQNHCRKALVKIKAPLRIRLWSAESTSVNIAPHDWASAGVARHKQSAVRRFKAKLHYYNTDRMMAWLRVNNVILYQTCLCRNRHLMYRNWLYWYWACTETHVYQYWHWMYWNWQYQETCTESVCTEIIIYWKWPIPRYWSAADSGQVGFFP